MLKITSDNIYISSANVDLRNGIEGLSSIVQKNFKIDPFSNAMFVFHNRNCDKVKILYWDKNGFCLLYKRIERDKFHFPSKIETDKYTISNEELNWLLHGLKIEEINRYENYKKKKVFNGKNN